LRFVKGLYIILAMIVFVNLISEFILKGEYSAIASWIMVMLFLVGTIFFVNAKHYLYQK